MNKTKSAIAVAVGIVLSLSLLTACGGKPASTTSPSVAVKTSEPPAATIKLERKSLTTLAGTDLSLVSVPRDGKLWLSLEKGNGATATELQSVEAPEPINRIAVVQGKDGNASVVGVMINSLGIERAKEIRKLSVLYEDKGTKPYSTFLSKSVVLPLAENATAAIAKLPQEIEVLGVVFTDNKGTPISAYWCDKTHDYDQNGKLLVNISEPNTTFGDSLESPRHLIHPKKVGKTKY